MAMMVDLGRIYNYLGDKALGICVGASYHMFSVASPGLRSCTEWEGPSEPSPIHLSAS